MMMQGVDDPMDLEMQLLSPPQVDHHGGGLGAKQMIHAAILVVPSVQVFLEGISEGSPPVSRVCSSKSSDSSPEQDEEVNSKDMEEITNKFMDGDQAVPLIKTVDNTLHSRKEIRTLTQVLRSCLAFKAHAASVASDNVHHDNSGATEGRPEVAEASDSLFASSEHHITIDQPARHSQIKSISEIVRQKNLQTLKEFGGVDGVKDALGTDLNKGISEEEALHRQHEFSLYLAPTHPFFHLIWKEVKKKSVLLLSLAAALSIVFRIQEEGLQDGWTDGAVVLIAIVLQVFFASIHKYWKEQRARKKLQKQQLKEGSVRELHVIRGGESKDVSESELVYGDLLLLKKGCQVPAEGLFVDGENLELDYAYESFIINEHHPFLSYGKRVTKGDARMVVTSTYMMMKATNDLNARFKLEANLGKLNTCMHYIQVVIIFLIILVLFLRYIAGKIDDDTVYRPESMAEPSGIRCFSNTFEKMIKESKHTTKGLMKLLSVLLVGLTEGVPFIVPLAIVYWNEETLSGKATEQDLHVILKMASVNIIICTDAVGEFNDDDTEVKELFIGGEFISESERLSSNVVEALCDGICTSNENAYQQGAYYELNKERTKQIQHLNGPANVIMSKCTHYYNTQGEQVAMSDTITRDFNKAKGDMEGLDLKPIAIACKHADAQTQDADDWILVALLGLKKKNKDATKAEVKACRESGIEIIIVSSKKLQVLKNIPMEYGLTANEDPQHSVFRGEDFRKCTDEKRREIVDKIHVLGEAFSSDKSLLVETLRKKGEVVFLGQRTDEVPALMRANIGIAMGRWSSEKARESSDIIIWDGNLAEIISMVHSGRCIFYNIQSFLQPVLITTISSILINVIQTAAWGDASLTIFQSVYVNLAVLFLGGLALLTKTTTDKPKTCGRSLITSQMTRNIILQVGYQVTCLVIIQTKGSGIVSSSYMKTVVSNIFIICQFFNLFNARELQKKNFFRGSLRHIKFWVAIITFMVLHVTFVEVQDIFGYGPTLNWKLWAGCVLVGVLSWLVDWLGKCIHQGIRQ